MMITGDGSAIAQTIAEKVQLDSVHARSLPQDKLTILESIPKDQRPVAMVGDGVNDAPDLLLQISVLQWGLMVLQLLVKVQMRSS